MALKDFSYTLIGVYTDLVIFCLMTLLIICILIIEIRRFYLSQRDKAATELANASSSGGTHVDVQMSADLGDLSDVSSNPNTSETSKNESSVDSATPSTAASTSSLQNHHVLMILSVAMYISHILGLSAYIFTSMENGIIKNCVGVGTAGFFYMFGKCFLYLIFIYRLYSVYSQSVFEYNTNILIVVGIFTVIWTLLMSIMNLITKKTVIIDIEGHTFCAVENNGLVLLGVIVYDLFINVLCCYFFIRPLFWLNKMNQNKETEDVRSVVVKYVILTFMTVGTTVISLLLLIVSQMNGTTAIDTLINCVCIMLFNKAYDKHYNAICCGAHQCGSKIINKCCIKK